MWKAFDVVGSTEKRYLTKEGTIILEERHTGTHIGDFMGVAPTGNLIDFKATTFIDFKDGLMLGERIYYDLRTLLAQIGAKK